MFNIFASLAEFERDLIRERTNAGLAAARARGRAGGRPTSHSPDKLRTAKRLYEQRDMTVAQIGEVLGVSRSTVYRALRKGSQEKSNSYKVRAELHGCVVNLVLSRGYRRWPPIR